MTARSCPISPSRCRTRFCAHSGSGEHRRLVFDATNLASRCYNAPMFPSRRIVCLTEETVETLYLLGEEQRIVGVSGYVVRPKEARRDKPRVSAFTSADTGKI